MMKRNVESNQVENDLACQHMTHQMLWKALLVRHPEKLLQVATYVAIYSKRKL